MAVQVAIPDEYDVLTPLAGVRLTVLPYDRDSLLADLERSAPSPRPSTARLDSLFQAFREPFGAYLQASARHARLVRASEAGASGAADSLAALAPRLEAARATLARARRELQPAIDSLRRQLAAWEDSAYRGYDSITAGLVRRPDRAAVVDTTGPAGWTDVLVPKGTWWVTARAVNVLDPNSEWYWNVRVTGDTIRLDPSNGRIRPRL